MPATSAAAAGALLIVRLVLAGVFALSGLAKLLDPAGSRSSMRDFGVPGWAVGAAALVLPVLELLVAAALLIDATAAPAALAGAVLLVLFAGGIARNLLHGKSHACHCFGRLSRAPISWGAVGRNAVLAALALLVVLMGPGHALTSRAALPWLAGAVLAAAGAGGAALLWALWRQQARLLLRIEELETAVAARAPEDSREPAKSFGGLAAPAFEAVDLEGRPRALAEFLALGQPVVLLFTDPACGPCRELLPSAAAWQRERADRITLVTVARGDADAMRREAAQHGLAHVLVQDASEVGDAFGVRGTPSAVAIGADGTLAAPVASGATAIRALVERMAPHVPARAAAARPAELAPRGSMPKSPVQTLTIGSPAPEVHALDESGGPASLARLAGRPALLVFWNPACGFCRAMAPDLEALTAPRPGPRAHVVLIASGSAQDTRALGVSATLWLDRDGRTIRAFGVQGTPSACLVDAAGRVASPIVVGAMAVLDLARSPLGAPAMPAAPGAAIASRAL